MKLYEIEQEILSCVDMETGEIIDIEKLEQLEMCRDEKIENICLWIKNLTSDAEALKAEKDAFEKRQKAAEDKVARLKNFLTNYLDGNKFETTKVKVSFRGSESVEVADISALPEKFLKFKDPEPDKTAIKTAIKAGDVVAGASIVQKQNIQIK